MQFLKANGVIVQKYTHLNEYSGEFITGERNVLRLYV